MAKQELSQNSPMTKEELEEFEQFKAWKKSQAESSNRSSSPPKKQKTEEDSQSITDIDPEFAGALQGLGVDYTELDPSLRQHLRHSQQARKDFLVIHRRADLHKYDPATGSFQEDSPARKRDFASATSDTNIDDSLEPTVREAMLTYHTGSVLPNMSKLFEQCDLFYNQVATETAMQQFYNEKLSAQVQSLEQSRANKTLLLHDLPPVTSKAVLESNINHFLYGAGLTQDSVAALHNHLVTSTSSTVRIEFTTENFARQFQTSMRNSKKYWKVPNASDTRVKVEIDQPTDDRISSQPYFALLDILGRLEPTAELQTWKQTLQIWTSKDQPQQQLLAQVSYVLDPRFPRRYSCLVLIAEKHYDAVLQQWHSAFSQRMRSTMVLIQALKRAITDRTTTSRSSADKAFDLANTPSHLACFPYPIFPVKMSEPLGQLLESHPMLPFQGAGGLLPLTTQAFQDYGINPEEFGKGAAPKPRSSKGYGKSSKGKTKNSKGKKGSSPGPKGRNKERDHDHRTDWKNQDDNDHDSWGKKWSHYTQNYSNWSSPRQQGGSQGKNRTPKGNNKGWKNNALVQQVRICLACTCALGYNYNCHDCSKHPIPPCLRLGSVSCSSLIELFMIWMFLTLQQLQQTPFWRQWQPT